MSVWLWLLLSSGCSAYNPKLIPKPYLGADGGMTIVGDAAIDAAADSGDASQPDTGTDAALPDCSPTENPDCPMSCHEVCNGIDDDCDGKIDEMDARSEACTLPAASTVCANATCLIASCNDGFVDCNQQVDDGCEVTLDSIDDCGTCGHRCTLNNAGARCEDGTCAVDKCNSGFGDCDNNVDNGCEQPLNTLTDCGGCGKSCNAAHASTSCGGAVCKFESCSPGFGDCNQDSPKLGQGDGCETDLTSVNNCGACGHKCEGATPYCSGGKCTAVVCDSGHADCDGDNMVCETDLHTLASCGGCAIACGPLANANVSCSTGVCVPTCKAGYKSCDNSLANGCETALNTSTSCGDCGVGCAYANATTSCASGSCQLSGCVSGYGDCNKSAADGCEQRLNTNTNCGACGQTCGVANATPTCSSGSCQIGSCNGGFANCDGRADTGCEINLNTDHQNCGACNQVCGSNLTCQGGRCVCTSDSDCGSGQSCCNGSCVNKSSDEANCGTCGNACANGSTCCSGSCKDLSSDIKNCGSCGSSCGSNANRCTSGSCRCATQSPCGGFSKCCTNGCSIGLICF